MTLLSLALGCARSRTPDGEGERDGAVVRSDASIAPSLDGGRDLRDGAVAPTDPPDGGRRADAGPPPSPDALALARAECGWSQRCRPGELDALFFGGEAGCVEALARAYEPTIARGNAAPPSQWCGASYALDADCDGFRDDDGGSIVDCVEPAGRLRSGDACLLDVECGRSATGREMRCVECQCRPLLREGDEGCSDDGACETGLFCTPRDFRMVCARYRALPDGADCTAPSDLEGCALGSRCFEGTCMRQPRRGEACDPTEVPCFEARDLRVECVADASGARRCEATPFPSLVQPGEPCGRGETCVGGARCPSAGVCPSECRGNVGACGVTGACNEATGECALRQVCVDG